LFSFCPTLAQPRKIDTFNNYYEYPQILIVKIEESLGKSTFEDWKNRKVVLQSERRDFDLEGNIPIVKYTDFSENDIKEIKQEKELIFLHEQHKIFEVLYGQYNNRLLTTKSDTLKFNHQELALIDDYLFGKVPHIKVDNGGVYSIKNQRNSQLFTKDNYENNFEGVEFDFVGVNYSQSDFCMEAFVFALWKIRRKIKEEMKMKFERLDVVFANWEARYLFDSYENELSISSKLKKSDYDFLFYKMKEVKAIKQSVSQYEYVLFLSFHNPNINFDIPDFKKRIENEKRQDVFNKIYEKSSFKQSVDGGFTIYCSL
jgi:hypothetical protein